MSSTPDNNRPDRDSSCAEPSRSVLEVEINIDPIVNEPIDQSQLREAVVAAARSRRFCEGKIGIRVTDDETIQTLNRRHIGHDYPTDVISFGYDAERPYVEGEMVVSAVTASRKAGEIGWSAESELVLYVVHGTLHITGMDDQEATGRAQMRAAEHDILTQLGIEGIKRFGADVAGAPTATDPPNDDVTIVPSDEATDVTKATDAKTGRLA